MGQGDELVTKSDDWCLIIGTHMGGREITPEGCPGFSTYELCASPDMDIEYTYVKMLKSYCASVYPLRNFFVLFF